MSDQETNTPELTPIKFQFYKINFTPFVHSANESSESIIHKVMSFLSKQQVEEKGILIDKHEGRDNAARRLFVTSTAFNFREKRIKCSIALLRSGKIPMLKPADKFKLIPFDISNGEIAELTHFFIDYSTTSIVMCVEFNSSGPRASDIEYYLRVIAHDKLNLARGTELIMYMNTSIDKTLKELKNVLKFEMKIQPGKIAEINKPAVQQYFTGLANFANIAKPKFVKVEALFQSPGKLYDSSELNSGANTMVSQILRYLQEKPTNLDAFEHFEVKYVGDDGKEEFFNLLKGKMEIIKSVEIKKMTGRDWYELIKLDFDNFIESIK